MGGYNFFERKDASKAFVSSQFDKGLVEDASGLSNSDYSSFYFYSGDWRSGPASMRSIMSG